MSEEKFEQIEIDLIGWFAVCDAEEIAQAIFPSENLAIWYLEKYGWTGWKIFRIFGKNDEMLFLFEDQNRRAEDDQN